MKTIYYLSGLGADERVFKFLKIDFERERFIRWEVPQKRENLQDYCKRLIAQINLSDEIILIGVSFGGIIAQEISKIIKVDKLIIISSIKSFRETSWQLQLVRIFQLYKIVPARFLKWSNLLTRDYYFSTKTKAESELLRQIIIDTDKDFMKWAIERIMTWNSNNLFQNIIHIQGDKDRIFPISKIIDIIRIKDGGHFMIVSRAQEISDIIKKEINIIG